METIGCEIWNVTKCCLFFYVPVLVNMPVWYNEQNKKWGHWDIGERGLQSQ